MRRGQTGSRNRQRRVVLGRLVPAALLALAAAATHAEPAAGLRWYAADALAGRGSDCGRLLAPGQKVAPIILADEAQRAALLTDDGRLLFLVRSTDRDTPADGPEAPPRLVEKPAQTPTLAGRWPNADCRLDGWPWPDRAALPAVADARFAPLLEIAADTEAALQASMHPGGMAARAERRRRAQTQAAALLGASSALPQHLAWRAQSAEIDAGRVIDELGPGEARLQALRSTLGPHAHATLETLVELVTALMTLERFGEALARLDETLPGARAALGEGHRQVLQMERHRARATLAARGAADAKGAAEALLARAERALPADDPLLFDCRLLLGQVLLRDGRYVEAVAQLEPLARQIGAERSQRAALLQDRLAAGYTASGRLSEGLLAQQRSLLMAESLLGQAHPDTLRGINNLANNLRQLNDNEAALPFARRAFEGYNALYGAGHTASITSARGLSLILGELGRPEESLQLIEPQIAAAIVRLGAANRQTLNTRIHQAELLDLVGRHADAVAVLEDILAPVTRVFGESGELTIICHGLLAGGYAGTGDRERARVQLGIAVARMGAIADQRRALSIMGFAARTAERIDDQQALATLLHEFTELADRTDRSGLSEDLASQVQVFRSGPYLRYVALLAERGEVDAAFDRSEQFKGRVLLATLGELAGDASPALPSAVRAELADLRRQVRAAEAEVAAARSDGARVEAGARREAAAQAYLARRAEAKRSHPRFAAVADAAVLGSADVDRMLAADTCLLSFVVGETRAGVFVLGRRQPIRYLPLPAPKELEAVTQELRQAWSGEATQAGVASLRAGLTQALASALAGCPPGVRKLAISPDGPLTLLPFELLAPGGTPLGMRYELGYVQSFSVYGQLRQRPRTARYPFELLAVGAPSYQSERGGVQAADATGVDGALRRATLRSAVANLGHDGTAARRAFDVLGVAWTPLPGAEREARKTAALFPRHRLLLGDAATEDRLAELNRRGELRRYRYLLFSTHGYLSPAHPLLSAIVLRQPGSAGYDGYLTAAELPLYDIDSDLIVLSACETGVGQVRAGSGVMGLPLALTIAGNRNAVVTLWRVPDASAADFVVRLFAELKAGQSPAAALARTKRAMATDRRYRDPLHWAGFVLYGVP